MFHTVCVTEAERPKRRYSSTLRAAQADQTRAVVLAAATQLFVARGWNGTSMRDVARAAAVSVETIYANFGSKAELLKQALDVAVVGDAEPVPLADRDYFARLANGDALERAAAAAEFLATMHPRTAHLRRVLNQAAAGDEQLSELLRSSLVDERESVRQGVLAVAQRPVSDDDIDALFAILSTEAFLLLTDSRGWTREHYQSWIAQMMQSVLRLEGATDE